MLALVTLLMVMLAAAAVAVTGGSGPNELLLPGLLDHASTTHLYYWP